MWGMKRACHKNEEAQDINDWENDCLTNIVQGCPIKYHSVKLQTEKCPYIHASNDKKAT